MRSDLQVNRSSLSFVLSAALLGFAVAASTGCTGLVEDSSGGGGGGGTGGLDAGTPAQQKAMTAWVEGAYPALQHADCTNCHSVATSNNAPLFLAGSSADAVLNTLLTFPQAIVNLSSPAASLLLTEGSHTGPAIDPTDLVPITAWLTDQAAAAAGSGSAAPIAGPATVTYCPTGTAVASCPLNTLSLNTMVPGAEITFVAFAETQGINIYNLTLVGGAEGVYIDHPLFTTVNSMGSATIDSIDRFSGLTVDVAANSSAPVTTSIVELANFPPANQLEIAFTMVTPYMNEGSGSGSATLGCKALTSFVTNAIPVMGKTLGAEGSNCVTCHGGTNSTATNIMNLTNLNSGSATAQAAACASVLPQLGTLAATGAATNCTLFLQPDPGTSKTTGHPFNFTAAADYTTFMNGIQVWAKAEYTAEQ